MPRRVFTAVAWLLVALWLPAVLHCAVEASGVFDASDCCEDQTSDVTTGEHCTTDHCEAVEAGAPREDDSVLPVQAPQVLLEVLRIPRGEAPAGEANGISPVVAAPPEIAGQWRRSERVAPLTQAP